MYQSRGHLTIALAFLILLFASSCGLGNILIVNKTQDISSRELSYPAAQYDILVWLPSKGLVALTNDIYKPSTQQVRYAFERDAGLHYLPFMLDPNCKVFTRYYPSRLFPDGRMGVYKMCGQGDATHDSKYLSAYDWDTQETQQIVAGALPSILSGGDAWNPDMTRGVMEIYSGLDGTLFWISPQGVEPMNLTLSNGKRSWSLSDAYPKLPVSNDYGIVFAPAWSPDGKTIAFWASFEAIGMEGQSRSLAEFDLVFLDPIHLSYSIVLEHFYLPDFLSWSPDGKWLVFKGRRDFSRQNKLWLFSPIDKKLRFFAEGYFGDVVWSPDSSKVAAIYCYDVLCEKQSIMEYDLTEITSK